MTSHNEAQQIPPAGLGDTPLHSLMHLLSIQFSLWSCWCLALSQGCFWWYLLQTPSRSTHLFYLPYLEHFFYPFLPLFPNALPRCRTKNRHCCVVLRPASVFTFASAASSHISPSLRMSRVLALCSDTWRQRLDGNSNNVFW